MSRDNIHFLELIILFVINDEFGKSDGTAVALVEAESEDKIWEVIAKYFPDYEYRFCEKREAGWMPNDRFSDFEKRTSLYGKETT